MGLSIRLPEPGELVGDYRIEGKLGDGGFGTVFKAERAGGLYAVKFLHGVLLESWARREISILLHLEHPNVVRLIGADRWPDPNGAHYIVMEFVGGRTLESYAEEENPSARRCARIVLDIALTLAEVHRQGVFHRDLKPDNVIIRDANARPVLVDFGVGSLVGARNITGKGAPPGTFEFRAPESWLFSEENDGKDVRYEYGAADEMWALGVTFFWLLTDLLPFGERREPGMVDRIITHCPKAAHLINERVPRSLSDICMRMLEKRPEDRYASVVDLCAALESAMAEAELDGSWDLPLIDPDAPDRKPTVNDPAMEDASMRWLGQWRHQKPKRGQKPAEKEKVAAPAPVAPVEPVAPAAPVVAAPAAPVAEAAPSQAPAPSEAARPAPPPPAPPPPAPAPSRGARLFPPGAFFPLGMVLDMLKVPALGAALLAIVLGAALVVKPAEPTPASAPVAVSTSSEATATWHAGFVHEVAIPWNPSESSFGGEGAEPALGTSTPAPTTMTAMVHEIEKKPIQKKKRGLRALVEKCVGAACCATLAGCPAPQVRPTPAPEECPPGAVETMKELGIEIGAEHGATFPVAGPPETVTVEEGFTSVVLLGPWKELPSNTVFRGRLFIGEDRVLGRFTEAETPGGKTFPVCMELRDRQGGRGAIRKADGAPDRARIFSTVEVRAVDQFE